MEKRLPFAHSLFMRIAEPRTMRLIQFGIYGCLLIAGIGVLFNPPPRIEWVLGSVLVYVFGSFITLGATLGAVAVLPGIWWLERAAIIALSTGLAMYSVIAWALAAGPISNILPIVVIMTFVQRWFEIKGAQLAPRER